MGISFLLKGLLIGLSISAPLGPIGILCITRTLTGGARLGFICGLGAAVADALYALAGILALSIIGQWIVDDRTVLRVVGGVFLVYLGARTFMRPPIVLPTAPTRARTLLPPGARAAFTSTFLLTLANPITLLSFAAVFAGLGVAPVGSLADMLQGAVSAVPLVLGVFLGSALWWLFLSTLMGRLRRFIGARSLGIVNRVSGTILTAFGLYAMASLAPLL